MSRSPKNGRTVKGDRLYVPANLEIEKLLPAELARYADCANWLVHLVVRGRVLRQESEDGFIPLKVAYLRKVIPAWIERDIRKAVLDLGILECDGHYVRGEKSMGYRLCPQYEVAAKRVVCRDKAVAKRISNIRNTVYRTDITLPVHKHLHKWLCRLEIDAGAARKVVQSIPRLAEYDYLHESAIEMIDGGHVEFSYCRNGRVHSLVTRLARELRQHLRIDAKSLVNVDIANSQPMIFCLILKPHPTTHTYPTGEKETPTNTMHIIREKNSQDVRIDGFNANSLAHGDDIQKYIEICETGLFYDTLAERSGLSGLTRSEIKERCFKQVFFDTNDRPPTKMTDLFAGEFPTVMAKIRDMKKKDYRDLACILQKHESNLMIHRVCHRLAIEHPDIPIITIHDSIMTFLEHVECIKRIIVEEFDRVGLHPKLKVESNECPLAKAA